MAKIEKLFDTFIRYHENQNELKKLLHYYFNTSEIKNRLILDAGCRVGDYTLPLLEMGAAKVIGVDLSGQSIKAAQKKFRHNQKTKFYQGNIADLKKFNNSFFDVTICAGTISYLKPTAAKKTLQEFIRVTKPKGIILVMFQKEKSWTIKLLQLIAIKIPLKTYCILIKLISKKLAWPLKPIIERMIGRPVSLGYLKYNVLLGLRGLYFGIPVKIKEKFRIKTITCEVCSEKTTASYKIKLPPNKKVLQ